MEGQGQLPGGQLIIAGTQAEESLLVSCYVLDPATGCCPGLSRM